MPVGGRCPRLRRLTVIPGSSSWPRTAAVPGRWCAKSPWAGP